MNWDSVIRISYACTYPQRRGRSGAIALPSMQGKNLGWEGERRF